MGDHAGSPGRLACRLLRVVLPLAVLGLSGCGGETRGESRSAAEGERALPAEVRLPPLLAAAVAPEPPDPSRPNGGPPSRGVTAWEGPAPWDDGQAAPVFHPPEHMRGIYLNAWASGSRLRSEALIELARRTEVNTFVIDVKDASGFVSYPTRVGLARAAGADQEIRIRDIRGLLRRLEAEGIYPIARIVVFKDPLLAQVWPDLAVQDSAGGPWVDGKGHLWVNPWEEEVWDYHIELAREAVELGFPEVQWDYVRFPDRPAAEMAAAVFPGGEGKRRSQAIRAFLKRARSELADLDVPLTADVFGVAASVDRDVGIGQLWEDIVDVVDATLPMIYPSHYWPGSFGFQTPNDYPYEVVAAATRDALRRTEGVEGAGRIIPWLQSFTLGPPAYAAPEIRAQIQAVYDQGIRDWILWNSAGRYPEDAFEPVGGWAEAEEPMIRVAGRLLHPDLRFAPPELPSAPDTVGLGHAILELVLPTGTRPSDLAPRDTVSSDSTPPDLAPLGGLPEGR